MTELEYGFKSNVLASNPALFKELFIDENEDALDLDQLEVDEIIPEDEQDVHRMLSQLKRQGVIE